MTKVKELNAIEKLEAKTPIISTVIIKELSWIDSTRIIKWLQSNFRNLGGEYETKETKDTLTINLNKIAPKDREYFIDYLSSQKYNYVAE
jgi:Zn-dependent M32 family carboxypeptidase